MHTRDAEGGCGSWSSLDVAVTDLLSPGSGSEDHLAQGVRLVAMSVLERCVSSRIATLIFGSEPVSVASSEVPTHPIPKGQMPVSLCLS